MKRKVGDSLPKRRKYKKRAHRQLQQFPDLLKEFDVTANKLTLAEAKLLPVSNYTKYWWKHTSCRDECRCEHKWLASLLQRFKRPKSCPFADNYNHAGRLFCCNSLGHLNPDLLKEWDREENEQDPFKIAPGSHLVVSWICKNASCEKKCLHKWQTGVEDRTKLKGTNCPYCSGRQKCSCDRLVVVFPEVAAQYAPDNEIPVEDLSPHAPHRVKWICPKITCKKRHPHIWWCSVNNRTTHSSGCPYCATSNRRYCPCDSFASIYPNLAKEVHPKLNPNINLSQLAPKSGRRITWICSKNHVWTAILQSRTGLGSGCPECFSLKKSWRGETAVIQHLASIQETLPIKIHREWEISRLGYKSRLKCDFVLEIQGLPRLVIEFDGIQHFKSDGEWGKHFEKVVERDLRKNAILKKLGIPLLRIAYNAIPRVSDAIVSFLCGVFSTRDYVMMEYPVSEYDQLRNTIDELGIQPEISI